jgi:hypothetical protein
LLDSPIESKVKSNFKVRVYTNKFVEVLSNQEAEEEAKKFNYLREEAVVQKIDSSTQTKIQPNFMRPLERKRKLSSFI